MSVNFFKKKCQELTNASEFGICDDDNKEPAYLNFDNRDLWIATIKNASSKNIVFTAIDYCVEIIKNGKNMASRCDCMLEHNSTILFIELKTKREDWKGDGLKQIEKTLEQFIASEETYYYSRARRKCIVANSKHAFPHFNEFDSDRREYFKRMYKAHIQFEAEIVIK